MSKSKQTPADYRYEPESSHELANPDKVSPNKVCDYIRDAYLNGKTRLKSYAENVDPNIYTKAYGYRYKIIAKLEDRADFQDLKNMVMEEDQKDMLLRSSSAQRKAHELLLNTIESANAAVLENGDDPKTLQAAAGVLKTLMPAFQAINVTVNDSSRNEAHLKARAARVISGAAQPRIQG